MAAANGGRSPPKNFGLDDYQMCVYNAPFLGGGGGLFSEFLIY